MALIEAAALALWVGALAGFAFVYAPVTLAVLTNPTAFGPIALAVLQRLDSLGFWCGCIALVAVFLRSRDDDALGRGSALRALAVVLMILLVVIEAQVIVPAVHSALISSGNGVLYQRWHAASTAVFGAIMALGVVAFALCVLARPEPLRRRPLR